MASIRLDTINVDKGTLSIKNGNVFIANTDMSINSQTGALILKGGLGIYCSSDAVSSINGGALTVGGGVGIKGSMYLGDDLKLESAMSTITVDGIIYPRLFLDSINNKQFFISLDGIDQHLFLTPSKLILNLTQGSYDSSDGAVVVHGGVSINTNINSSSVTCGGSLTVGGGGSILGDFYIGESLFVSGGSINTLHINSSTSLGIDVYEHLDISGEHVNIFSNTLNWNNVIKISSDVSIDIPIIMNKIVNIKDKVIIEDDVFINKSLSVSNDIYIKNNVNTDSVIFKNGLNDSTTNIHHFNNYMIFCADSGYIFESTTSPLSIHSGLLHLNDYALFNDDDSNFNIISSYNFSHLNIYPTFDVDNNDNVDNIFCLYNKKDCLKLGFDRESSLHVLSIEERNSPGSSIYDFTLKNNNGGFILCTDGSFLFTSSKTDFDGDINVQSNINAKGSLSLLKDIRVGGDIYMESSFGGLHLSDKMNLCFSNNIEMNMISDTSNSDINISLYSLGNDIYENNHYECLNINNKIKSKTNDKEFSICSLSRGMGQLHSIKIFTGENENQLFVATNGNVGIKTSSPKYALDICGDIHGDTIRGQNGIIQNSLSCTDLTVNKDVNIVNDINVHHDVSVGNNMNVVGEVHCKNKLIVDDDVNVAKSIYLTGDIVSDQKGQFNNIVVEEFIQSNGRVVINCTDNQTSLSVIGGASIGGDIHIGGECSVHNTINMKSKNLVKIYDSVDVVRFGVGYNDHRLSISRHDDDGSKIEDVITIENTSGSVIFNNKSLNSVLMKGGLSIQCSENVINLSHGGALTIDGGASISKNMLIGGNVTILSTSQSNNMGSGALVVNGGLGVMNNINIGGNAIVNGDLIVKGNTTNISTENATIKDNIFVLNSGPSGSHDSGMIVQRYQSDNDRSKGDVVSDDPYLIDRLVNQNGVLSNQIKLSYLTSNIDDYYVNWWIRVDSGFSSNQVRKIIKYEGATHIATLSSPWSEQNPANGDVIHLHNKPFVGMIFNERLGLFEFGSTVQDPSSSNIIFTDNTGIMFSNGMCVNTSPSTSSSAGALVLMNGGLSINCDENAKNNTCGGGLTVSGGASIQKSVFIGGDLYVNNVKMSPNVSDILSSVSYTAFNDQLDIPFIVIDKSVISFDIFLGVVVEMVDPNENLYCNFSIRGVNRRSTWNMEINKLETTFMGDDTGIEFDIVHDPVTSNGIVRYSTPDYGTSVSNIRFRYKMLTN